MKTPTFIASLAVLAVLGTATARTWTSADGSKTFEGEFLGSDGTSVTVLKKGKKVTFFLNILSEADRQWVEEELKKPVEVEASKSESIEDQKIGKKLQGKTVRLVDKKFVAQDTPKVPQYYFVYYSASW